MGKALYREYRPKSLDDVVGQEHITNTLKNAIKKGAISHAYLFTGPRGVGKTSVARILAHAINGIPYNDESTELDIIEIDAASNRRIDEIRELRDKVNIAPTIYKYKVYIIDEVHMLTREAFNALLKTLEEPPEHVVFILATTESHKVPDTIISRTQRFSFKPIDQDNSIGHLRIIADKEKIDITDDALKLIAEHGNGSFRDSISMLDQLAGFSLKKLTAKNVSTLLGIPDNKILEDLVDSVKLSDVELLFNSTRLLRENGANSSKTAQQTIINLRKKLISNSNINSTAYIKLMKSLLPLTGAQSSYEAIEIVMLDSMTFDSADNIPKIEIVQQEAEKIKEEKEAKPEKPKDTKPEPTEKVISETTEDILIEENKEEPVENSNNSESSWNDVLISLKKHNNTLYGVLRMADTKVEEDKIILTFQFEFHKKQLHQAKNLATLNAIVEEQLGNKYIIESQVKKKTKNLEKSEAKHQNNDTISNVSNIFGGAELLES
jgi:DNA polymerase-3 subunit gamma/tau